MSNSKKNRRECVFCNFQINYGGHEWQARDPTIMVQVSRCTKSKPLQESYSRRYRSFSRARKDRRSFESGKSGGKQNHNEQPSWAQSSCDAPNFLISFSEALSVWRSASVPVHFGSGYAQISRRKPIIRTHLLSEKGSDYVGLVRLKGLEPTRIAAREPKGDVSTVKALLLHIVPYKLVPKPVRSQLQYL